MPVAVFTPLFALRLLLALAVSLGLDHLFGKDLVQSLLPLFHWELTHINWTYSILDLRLDRVGADSVIRLEAALARALSLGGQIILPEPDARAAITTLTGFVTQPLIIGMTLALAWPVARIREHAIRIPVLMVLALAVILIDVPLVLWGELWNLHVSALEPDRFSPLLIWKNFLQNGGRYALGLVIGFIAIAAGTKTMK